MALSNQEVSREANLILRRTLQKGPLTDTLPSNPDRNPNPNEVTCVYLADPTGIFKEGGITNKQRHHLPSIEALREYEKVHHGVHVVYDGPYAHDLPIAPISLDSRRAKQTFQSNEILDPNASHETILFTDLDRLIKDPYGPNDPTLKRGNPKDDTDDDPKIAILTNWYNARGGIIYEAVRETQDRKWINDRQLMARGIASPLKPLESKSPIKNYPAFSLAKQKAAALSNS